MDESNQSSESRRRSAAKQNRTAMADTSAVQSNASSAGQTAASPGQASRPGVESTTQVSNESGNGTDTGIVERVRKRAGAQLAIQKDMATDGMGTIARAIKRTTQELREQRHETMAEYVDRAADELERLSSGLKNKDIGELFRDAQNLARRQPAMFVGSAFAIGLLGARFLKSSSLDRGHQPPAWQRIGADAAGSQAKSGNRHSQAGAYGQPTRNTNFAGLPSTPGEARSTTTERGTSSRQRDGNPDAENI